MPPPHNHTTNTANLCVRFPLPEKSKTRSIKPYVLPRHCSDPRPPRTIAHTHTLAHTCTQKYTHTQTNVARKGTFVCWRCLVNELLPEPSNYRTFFNILSTLLSILSKVLVRLFTAACTDGFEFGDLVYGVAGKVVKKWEMISYECRYPNIFKMTQQWTICSSGALIHGKINFPDVSPKLQ